MTSESRPPPRRRERLVLRLARGLFTVAFRAHPREARQRFQQEAMAAYIEGIRRRSRSGRSAACRYALRATLDAAISGLRSRRRSGRTGKGGGGFLSWMQTDVVHAWRRIVRAPLYSAAVVLVLSLGIGANAAAFSALVRVAFASLPFPESDRLVHVRWSAPGRGVGEETLARWSYSETLELGEHSRTVFSGLAAYAPRFARVVEAGDAEHLPYELVSPGYFVTLGVRPEIGRFFTSEEGRVGSTGAVVLSRSLWLRRFGGDPDVLGRSIRVQERRLRVIGVAGDFSGLTGQASFWVPLGQAPELLGSWVIHLRDVPWLSVVARLAAGTNMAEATERLTAPVRSLREASGGPKTASGAPVLTPLAESVANPRTRQSLWLVTAASLAVLIIAVVNLAALRLAQRDRQAPEIAVRLALGIGRSRLARQELLEGACLGVGGAGLGILWAWNALSILRAELPEHALRGASSYVRLVDPGAVGLSPVLGVGTVLVAIVAGLLLGGFPVLVRRGRVPMSVLGAGPGKAGAGRSRGVGVREWSLGVQTALSVLLLVAAGLFLTTLYRLHAEQRGFDPEGLLMLEYSLERRPAAETPETARGLHRSFKRHLAGMAGVEAVALGTTRPLGGHFLTVDLPRVGGEGASPGDRGSRMGVHFIDEDYFRVLGTSVLEGRTFLGTEVATGAAVAVVNEVFARRLFPGESVLGREVPVGLELFGGTDRARVVGVVEDVLYASPTDGTGPEVYLPLGAWPAVGITALVRTGQRPAALVARAREALASLDAEVPFTGVSTGVELRRRDVAESRLLVAALSGFGVIALVLVATGLWALVAQSVQDRRREIGLRRALGARTGQVLVLVFRRGFGPVALGGMVGLAAAVALAPRITGLLFAVGPHDPTVLIGAVLILAAVAVLATWLPARRAARDEPMAALRGT